MFVIAMFGAVSLNMGFSDVGSSALTAGWAALQCTETPIPIAKTITGFFIVEFLYLTAV